MIAEFTVKAGGVIDVTGPRACSAQLSGSVVRRLAAVVDGSVRPFGAFRIGGSLRVPQEAPRVHCSPMWVRRQSHPSGSTT